MVEFWFKILVVVDGVGVWILVMKLLMVKFILWFMVLIMGRVFVVIFFVKFLLLKYYKFFNEFLFCVSNSIFIFVWWLVVFNVLINCKGVVLFWIIDG